MKDNITVIKEDENSKIIAEELPKKSKGGPKEFKVYEVPKWNYATINIDLAEEEQKFIENIAQNTFTGWSSTANSYINEFTWTNIKVDPKIELITPQDFCDMLNCCIDVVNGKTTAYKLRELVRERAKQEPLQISLCNGDTLYIVYEKTTYFHYIKRKK